MIASICFIYFLLLAFVFIPALVVYWLYCFCKRKWCEYKGIEYVKPSENIGAFFSFILAALFLKR